MLGGDAPGLVAGEEVSRRATSRLILAIDVGERVAVAVADNETLLAQLHVGVIDGPRWREAAGRHEPGRQCAQSPSAAALGEAEVPFGTERGWDVRSQSDLQR